MYCYNKINGITAQSAKKCDYNSLKKLLTTQILTVYYSINSENYFVNVLKTHKTTLKNFLQF